VLSASRFSEALKNCKLPGLGPAYSNRHSPRVREERRHAGPALAGEPAGSAAARRLLAPNKESSAVRRALGSAVLSVTVLRRAASALPLPNVSESDWVSARTSEFALALSVLSIDSQPAGMLTLRWPFNATLKPDKMSRRCLSSAARLNVCVIAASASGVPMAAARRVIKFSMRGSFESTAKRAPGSCRRKPAVPLRTRP